MVHLLVNGVRLKSVPYRLTTTHLRRLLDDDGRLAGPPPLRTVDTRTGMAVEVDRTANAVGARRTATKPIARFKARKPEPPRKPES